MYFIAVKLCMTGYSQIMLSGVAIFLVALATVNAASIEVTIQRLFSQIAKMQVKKTTEGIPPLTFHKDKGLYESDVKLYFHGDFEMYLLRESFQIFDNNNFATAWITAALIEANRLGNSPKPSEEQIFMSVDAMSKFYNKNLNYSNSLQNFWPQVYNETTKVWQSTPQNLLDLFDLSYDVPWETIFKLLEDFGQQELVNVLQKSSAVKVRVMNL